MLTYFKYIISSIFSAGLPREVHITKWRGRSGGFTLTELIVVITIATLITTTLVVQQSGWNDQLVLSTQTYELALMVRQAQIYSLGVRENVTGTGDKFGNGYGLAFDPDYSRYLFFADRNNNLKYDPGETIETKTLNRGVLIDRFCGVKGNGQEDDRCSPGQGNVAFLQIIFLRPDPKANIVLLNYGGNPATNVIPPASVYLRSPRGKYMSVKVESNGQISIQ